MMLIWNFIQHGVADQWQKQKQKQQERTWHCKFYHLTIILNLPMHMLSSIHILEGLFLFNFFLFFLGVHVCVQYTFF